MGILRQQMNSLMRLSTGLEDPDPRLGTAWEKGERLAKLVAHRRTLLVLDGLEPLQNPPGPQEGRLREPSLGFHYHPSSYGTRSITVPLLPKPHVLGPLHLVLQVGVGSAVSASIARQIENAVDWPDRVEGAGVAALERHLARPVVVDPVLVA